MLEKLDPEYYNSTDINNPRRLIRAIDVIWQTNKKYSEIIKEPKAKRNFTYNRICLNAERNIIYERINQRVEIMLENGLINEVSKLIDFRNKTALQTVGYTEIFNYLDGIWDLNFAIEEIKKNTRRYAKRQETWNKKLENLNYLEYNYTEKKLLTLLDKI